MADLHALLLDAIAGDYTEEQVAGLEAALRAVVELHAPDSELPNVCASCCCSNSPCSTIRVIADALGVPIEERTEEEGG